VVSNWGEVVTRYPYRKVGMDHLLYRENESQGRDSMWSQLR